MLGLQILPKVDRRQGKKWRWQWRWEQKTKASGFDQEIRPNEEWRTTVWLPPGNEDGSHKPRIKSGAVSTAFSFN